MSRPKFSDTVANFKINDRTTYVLWCFQDFTSQLKTVLRIFIYCLIKKKVWRRIRLILPITMNAKDLEQHEILRLDHLVNFVKAIYI